EIDPPQTLLRSRPAAAPFKKLFAEEVAEEIDEMEPVLEPVMPSSTKLRGTTGTLDDLREISRDFQPESLIPVRRPSAPEPTPAPAPPQAHHLPIPGFATAEHSSSGMMVLIS